MYTVLLVIALLAVLTGIAFLWAELAFYDYKTKGMPPVAMQRSQDGNRGFEGVTLV